MENLAKIKKEFVNGIGLGLWLESRKIVIKYLWLLFVLLPYSGFGKPNAI